MPSRLLDSSALLKLPPTLSYVAVQSTKARFDRRCASTSAIYVQRRRYGQLAETPRYDIASAARARRTMAEVQSSSRSQQAYAAGAV